MAYLIKTQYKQFGKVDNFIEKVVETIIYAVNYEHMYRETTCDILGMGLNGDTLKGFYLDKDDGDGNTMAGPMLPVKLGVAIAQNTPKYLSNMLVNQGVMLQASTWEEKHLRRSWCNWFLWEIKEDYDLKGDLKQ